MHSKIYFGDSRQVLEGLDSLHGKVSMVITSPPYFVGREYEDYLSSWSDYWKMLMDVFEACDKLLEPGGKFCVNFADRYANYKYFGRPLEVMYTPHYKSIFTLLDYDLWARIIWNKNRMPDGARHVTSKSRWNGRMRVTPDWEYIFVWRKPGDKEDKNIEMSKEEWATYCKGVWNINPVSKNPTVEGVKLALFPEELPRRLIKMYSQKDDIILDPFNGRGTTVKVAMQEQRIGIGVERLQAMREYILEYIKPDLFTNKLELINAT
jgi:DNA modification methylase